MTHLTEKENFMRLINGKDPEWLPVFSFGYNADRIVPTMKIGPELLYDQYYHPGIWKDLWGVPYESSASAGNQKLPQPNVFIPADRVILLSPLQSANGESRFVTPSGTVNSVSLTQDAKAL